jgi:hypothetical protein
MYGFALAKNSDLEQKLQLQSQNFGLPFSEIRQSADRHTSELNRDLVGGTNLFNPARNVIMFLFTILICRQSSSSFHLAFSFSSSFFFFFFFVLKVIVKFTGK